MLALLEGLRFETELAHECRTKLVAYALELLEERLCLSQHLLARFSLDACDRRLEPILQPRDSLLELAESISILAAQRSDQRLRFAGIMSLPINDGAELFAHVCLEHVRAMPHVVLELGASVGDVTIQSRETPFELDEDVSQENVANALEAGAVLRGVPRLGGVGWFIASTGTTRPRARRWFGGSLRFFLFRHAPKHKQVPGPATISHEALACLAAPTWPR